MPDPSPSCYSLTIMPNPSPSCYSLTIMPNPSPLPSTPTHHRSPPQRITPDCAAELHQLLQPHHHATSASAADKVRRLPDVCQIYLLPELYTCAGGWQYWWYTICTCTVAVRMVLHALWQY